MALRLAIGLAVGAGLVLLSVKKRLLTLAGALLALLLLLDILAFGGYAPAVYVILVFLLSGIGGMLAPRKEGGGKHPPRGIRQVAANGGVAGICLLLYGIFDTLPLLVGYYAAIAEFFTDTLASDIGIRAKGRPFDLARMKRTERGRSGGVSLLGTAASLLGALVCLLLALGAGLSPKAAVIAAAASFLGMLCDSILGSLLQAKYTCTVCAAYTEKPFHCGTAAEKTGGLAIVTNSTVNLLSNVFAALLAILLALLI